MVFDEISFWDLAVEHNKQSFIEVKDCEKMRTADLPPPSPLQNSSREFFAGEHGSEDTRKYFV